MRTEQAQGQKHSLLTQLVWKKPLSVQAAVRWPGELEPQAHGPWPQHCSVSVPLTVQCTKQTPFCAWGPQQAGLSTGHLRGVRRTATKATETSQRGKWQTKNSRIPETIILKTKMNQSEDVEKVGI